MSAIEQAYIDALLVELSRPRDAEHAEQIKAELVRLGAPVVETASRVVKVETAATPRRKQAQK